MANNALREVNWRAGNWEGWSLSRQGYLAIPEFAYALAVYARARGEVRPGWAKYLRPDARAYFKIESKVLAAGRVPAGSDRTGPTELMLGQPAARELPDKADVPEDEAGHSKWDAAEQDDAEDNSATGEVEPQSDQSADSHFTQGSLYAAQGEHELAVASYSCALELNPDDSEAWLQRARSQLRLRRFSEVIDDCSRCLDHDPDCLTAQCCRAYSYLWLRQYAQALRDMDAGLRIDKRDPQIHFIRGLAHLGLGNNRRAIADLNNARRFAPNWADIYLARSRAYEALGKTRHAKADLAEAIRREPVFADKATREASLACISHPYISE
jgi:tetratricopeptide (TPR) repeat protein